MAKRRIYRFIDGPCAMLFIGLVNFAIVFASRLFAGISLIERPVLVLLIASYANAVIFLLQRRSDLSWLHVMQVEKALLLGCLLYYALAVLFGASLFTAFPRTASWSLWMSTLTALPASLVLGVQKEHLDNYVRVFQKKRYREFKTEPEIMLFWTVSATLFASWLACIVIPLDWNRPWQKWPIPNVLLASIGYLVAALACTIYTRLSIPARLRLSFGPFLSVLHGTAASPGRLARNKSRSLLHQSPRSRTPSRSRSPRKAKRDVP